MLTSDQFLSLRNNISNKRELFPVNKFIQFLIEYKKSIIFFVLSLSTRPCRWRFFFILFGFVGARSRNYQLETNDIMRALPTTSAQLVSCNYYSSIIDASFQQSFRGDSADEKFPASPMTISRAFRRHSFIIRISYLMILGAVDAIFLSWLFFFFLLMWKIF